MFKFMSNCTSGEELGQRQINITRNAIGPKSGQRDCKKKNNLKGHK